MFLGMFLAAGGAKLLLDHRTLGRERVEIAGGTRLKWGDSLVNRTNCMEFCLLRRVWPGECVDLRLVVMCDDVDNASVQDV
jgi:hypothetical protein